MSGKRKFVNLDAMIPRADFAVLDSSDRPPTTQFQTISLRDLEEGSLLLPNLRKPDFQRETNHWTPAQVVSLIRSFFEGDLIPSVILWSSPADVFVIDGGHRLSALRAWILNDYGDGPLSQQFFGYEVAESQKKAAKETRKLVEDQIGTWQHWLALNQQKNLPEDERKRTKDLITRAVAVQWVWGDAEKAESSFFKINKQGTPLDDIETLLITHRKKPGAIAARSIIRSGMGHKYWSMFAKTIRKNIEAKAGEIFHILFQPEVDTPVKTLNLPLGGSVGIRTTLALLIDFVLVSNRDQNDKPAGIEDQQEDLIGDDTIKILDKTLALAKRLTGNDKGSLGLHPAVYFYGPSGRHTTPLFMGMAILIARKLINNDRTFFPKFTKCRAKLEEGLIQHKQLLSAIIQQTRSGKRYGTMANLYSYFIDAYSLNKPPTEQDIIEKAGVTGKVIIGVEENTSMKFSDETKSAVVFREILATALRCQVCGGYLDTDKSVSYDHIKPVRDGGIGNEKNCQLTHPYCNQSVKQ